MKKMSKRDIKLVQKEFEKAYGFYVRGFDQLPDRELCGKLYKMLCTSPGTSWEKLMLDLPPSSKG